MSMEIYTSNDLGSLAKAFADYCRGTHKDIFEPDLVMVQSMGMQRWLAMQIGEYCGICANVQFLFPNNFFNDIIKILFQPQQNELDQSSRDAAVWYLMRALPTLKGESTFAFLNNYLQHDPLGLKLYQISQKLADLYDQYALFRPLWVKTWPGSSPEQLKNFAEFTFKHDEQLQTTYVWQALLWQRCLSRHVQAYQWPFLMEKLIGVLADPLKSAKLPKETFIFGVSYLPPLYLDLLQILSRRMHIFLLLLNPSEKYWGDALSKSNERAIKREFAEKYGDLSPDEISQMAHLTGGNRLLANWGGVGRQMFQKLWEMGLPVQEQYFPPGEDTMLHVLQSDILTLKGRGRQMEQDVPDSIFSENGPPLPYSSDDHSLQIHICHGPLREIEVLHDNLLAMFERDPDLKPEDIVVIAPDINLYEPYINAVFASRRQNNTRLNFSISDRLPLKQGLTAAFLLLLDISKTRFEVDKVLALLEIDGIRNSFGIADRDLPQIEQWLHAAQIRWGLDQNHLNSATKLSDNDDNDINTWAHGLQRLLLTCAMPGFMQAHAYDDILSINSLDFDQKPLLGRLLNFVKALGSSYNFFNDRHTAQQWQQLLQKILDDFFSDDSFYAEKGLLQKALQNLVKFSELAGFDGKMHLETVTRFIETKLDSADFERGFLSNGVTFCSAKPMRSIPFKVICFLGMDLESFPAKEHNASFDLIAQNRRRGDRSKRLDDKYLFLEALISARDIFYISYTGFDANDNSIIPPAVLVSELLEQAEAAFLPGDDQKPVAEHITTVHKMHAFDNAYFAGGDDRYFSYSRENFIIAGGEATQRASFINDEFRLDPNEKPLLTEITPQDFVGFFLNPAKAYAQKRLNISLDVTTESLANIEPLDLTGLEGYAARKEILNLMLENTSHKSILSHLKQSGRLPHGNLAAKVLNETCAEMKPFAARILAWQNQQLPDARPYTQNIDVQVGALHIKGALPVLCLDTGDHRRPVQLCYFSYSRDKAEHKLAAWLYHLLAGVGGIAGSTVLLDCEQTLEYTTVAEPALYLEKLAELYLKGLQKPLAFFPKTGLKYCQLLYAQKPEAAGQCLTEWHDSDFSELPREGSDIYVKLCFIEEHGSEIPSDFYEIAPQICEPLFRHMVVADEERL